MATKFIESGSDATQDLAFWTATANTVASDNAQSRTGPRSIKASATGANQNSTITKNSILVDTGSRITFGFRTDGFPSSGSAIIAQGQNSQPGSQVFQLEINSLGKLVFTPTGATAVTGVPILGINTWYRISISYYITNTTTFKFNTYINGDLAITNTAGTLTRTGSDRLQLLMNGGATTLTNKNHWFDDIFVDTGASTTSQPDTGDIRVTAKRPNANGTANNFVTQIGSGGSGYGTGHSPQVNEQPLSVTNGWSIVAVGATTEEYNIENIATGDVDFSSFALVDYMGWIYYKTVLSETASIVINGVSTPFTSTGNANTFLSQAAGSTTYPAITGTDIGMVTDATATTVSLFECGIVFAYIVNHNFLSSLGVGI